MAHLPAKWCGPELQASDVREVVALSVSGEEQILCLTGFGRRGAGPALLLVPGLPSPLVLELPEGLPRISKLWSPPGPPGDSVLAVGPALDAVYRLTFHSNRSTSISLLVELPKRTDSVDCWLGPAGQLTVAVFDDRCEPIGPDDPRVEPPPPRPLNLAGESVHPTQGGCWAVCRWPVDLTGRTWRISVELRQTHLDRSLSGTS
jgi:hypothetical protein